MRNREFLLLFLFGTELIKFISEAISLDLVVNEVSQFRQVITSHLTPGPYIYGENKEKFNFHRIPPPKK